MNNKTEKLKADSPVYITEARIILKKAEAALKRAGRVHLLHYKGNYYLDKAVKTAMKSVLWASGDS